MQPKKQRTFTLFNESCTDTMAPQFSEYSRLFYTEQNKTELVIFHRMAHTVYIEIWESPPLSENLQHLCKPLEKKENIDQ